MTTEREIEELQHEIARTRERLSSEIEALSLRLTPQHAREVAKQRLVDTGDRAVESVKHSIGSAASKAQRGGTRTLSTMRSNPLPVAMIAGGAGWLVYKAISGSGGPPRRFRRQERWEERGADIVTGHEPMSREVVSIERGEPAGIAGADIELQGSQFEVERRPDDITRGNGQTKSGREKGKEMLTKARSKVGTAATHTKERAKQRAQSLRETGRERAIQAKERSRDTYQSNPLAIGGAALVAGAAIGLLMPHTQREDQLLGEHREHLVERGRERLEEVKEQAVAGAKKALENVKEESERSTSGEELR